MSSRCFQAITELSAIWHTLLWGAATVSGGLGSQRRPIQKQAQTYPQTLRHCQLSYCATKMVALISVFAVSTPLRSENARAALASNQKRVAADAAHWVATLAWAFAIVPQLSGHRATTLRPWCHILRPSCHNSQAICATTLRQFLPQLECDGVAHRYVTCSLCCVVPHKAEHVCDLER